MLESFEKDNANRNLVHDSLVLVPSWSKFQGWILDARML